MGRPSFREEVIREVFETKKPFESEFEFEGPHGLRIFEWRAFPEFDEKGNIHSVLSINRDVTERRLAEQQLKESREQLERFRHTCNRFARKREQ